LIRLITENKINITIEIKLVIKHKKKIVKPLFSLNPKHIIPVELQLFKGGFMNKLKTIMIKIHKIKSVYRVITESLAHFLFLNILNT